MTVFNIRLLFSSNCHQLQPLHLNDTSMAIDNCGSIIGRIELKLSIKRVVALLITRELFFYIDYNQFLLYMSIFPFLS